VRAVTAPIVRGYTNSNISDRITELTAKAESSSLHGRRGTNRESFSHREHRDTEVERDLRARFSKVGKIPSTGGVPERRGGFSFPMVGKLLDFFSAFSGLTGSLAGSRKHLTKVITFSDCCFFKFIRKVNCFSFGSQLVRAMTIVVTRINQNLISIGRHWKSRPYPIIL
jgi:hypothetical protein